MIDTEAHLTVEVPEQPPAGPQDLQRDAAGVVKELEEVHAELAVVHAELAQERAWREQRLRDDAANKRQYSRRDAQRFAAELEDLRAELARERAKREEREAEDAAAVAYVQERIGRDQVFAALGMLKASSGLTAEQDEALMIMGGLRQIVGVLYAAARQEALNEMMATQMEQYRVAQAART